VGIRHRAVVAKEHDGIPRQLTPSKVKEGLLAPKTTSSEACQCRETGENGRDRSVVYFGWHNVQLAARKILFSRVSVRLLVGRATYTQYVLGTAVVSYGGANCLYAF
jgi:hypothetical protein